MLYREWASNVQSRRGRMVTLETLETLLKLRDPGYASVYSFSEEHAIAIRDSGSSSGMNQYPVTASSLTIDIDSGLEGLDDVREILIAKSIAFEVWESGGKGYHVIIPHAEIESIDLPHSHWKAVEALGIAEWADKSIYRHGSLISLPGRIHPKTRRKKSFVGRWEGSPIEVPLIPKPEAFETTFDANGGLDQLSSGLMRFINMLVQEPSPGNRHSRLWGSSKDLASAGLSYDTVLDIALRVNDSWENPKAEEEVTLAVNQAFLR